MHRRSRIILAAAATGLILGAGYMGRRFSDAVSAADQRVTGKSLLIRTRFGIMEYAVAGQGPPLLMIHGTGGGFDQGLSFSDANRRRGHTIIAPSRFGYLRSDYPKVPSSEHQADAFVELLDRLGIEKVPVAGGSAGALSATQFALRHPDRTSALILMVPAANVRGRDPVERGPVQEWLVRRILKSDLLFWSLLTTMPDRLVETLLATDPALLSKVPAQGRDRAYRILQGIMPIGQRWRGMVNDGRLAGHPAKMDFSKLTVPVLLISAEDDRFGTASTARDIAVAAPGAQLRIYPDGGHILLGHHEDAADEVTRFLANEHGRSTEPNPSIPLTRRVGR